MVWSQEKISTKQKNSCSPRGVIDSFSSTRLEETASGRFSGISLPDHTRRRCDHAVGCSVYEHDRVGIG